VDSSSARVSVLPTKPQMPVIKIFIGRKKAQKAQKN